jgi:four helix bundle protein
VEGLIREHKLRKGRKVAGKDFEELEVYRQAREFRKAIYAITAALPAEEKFNLAAQMRRAALSVTNNIAEGHGSYSFRHNIAYLRRSRGSIYELRDDLNACQDQQYIDPPTLDRARQVAARLS